MNNNDDYDPCKILFGVPNPGPKVLLWILGIAAYGIVLVMIAKYIGNLLK